MKRIVVKFGGATIADGERVRWAARSVVNEFKKGTRIAVVASAMGNATDELVEVTKVCTNGQVTAGELDEITAMGERAAVRVFAAALRSHGTNARYIDPSCEEWPIVTDDNFGRAKVDLAKTHLRVQKYISPLVDRGIIPVICGFLGRDAKGRTTTIGRGGSDITAFVIASCLGADEVIIVKDVEGVMSADPNMIKNPHLIKRIGVEEMRDLASYGARILHPSALNYKGPGVNAKIIHFRHGNLSTKGTTIIGPKGERMGVKTYEKPLAMLTIVGEEMQATPGILAKASQPLSEAKVNIFGVSVGPRSFSLYVTEEQSQRALELLHGIVTNHKSMKSVTKNGDIAMLIAESEHFIETPGIVAKLAGPLARERINIIEVFSSRASITFFVNWADSSRALRLLRQAMKEVGA